MSTERILDSPSDTAQLLDENVTLQTRRCSACEGPLDADGSGGSLYTSESTETAVSCNACREARHAQRTPLLMACPTASAMVVQDKTCDIDVPRRLLRNDSKNDVVPVHDDRQHEAESSTSDEDVELRNLHTPLNRQATSTRLEKIHFSMANEPLDKFFQAVSTVLDPEDIPFIVWGEAAMKLNGIPTGIVRIDILVSDDMFSHVESAFHSEGWKVSTGFFPRARAGFNQSGWEVVKNACLRYRYPPSVLHEDDDVELFVLPTSFVGLGSNPSLDSEEFTRIESFGRNVYSPSAYLMAKTIALTHIRNIRHESQNTSFSLLLQAWASYFYNYCGFHEGSLDNAEDDVKEFWRSVNPMKQWRVEKD